MYVSESINFVHSVSGNFEGALAADVGASAYASVPIARGHTTPGGPHHVFIKNIRLLTAQNLRWRVEIWSKPLPAATHPLSPETWAPLLTSSWLASEGTAYGTLFAYYTHNLTVPYEDMSGRGEMHLNLVNQDLDTAKSAGSAGFAHILVGTIAAAP